MNTAAIEGYERRYYGQAGREDRFDDHTLLVRMAGSVHEQYLEQYRQWLSKRYLWRGRRSGTGRGEGASGLAFDSITPGEGAQRTGQESESFVERLANRLVVAAVEPRSPGGPTERLDEEAVVFANEGPTRIALGGWTVADEAGHRFVVPSGTSVAPGGRLTLRTGRGSDTAFDVYWGRGRSVWNDDGDTVYVYDDAGDLITRRGYPFPSEPVRETPLAVASASARRHGEAGDALADESITFENTGSDPLDVGGWLVTDRAGHAYRVAEGTTVSGGERLRLHTGPGTDTDTDRFWGESSPVWNDDRDVVRVYDADGSLVLRRVFRAGSELVS